MPKLKSNSQHLFQNTNQVGLCFFRARQERLTWRHWSAARHGGATNQSRLKRFVCLAILLKQISQPHTLCGKQIRADAENSSSHILQGFIVNFTNGFDYRSAFKCDANEPILDNGNLLLKRSPLFIAALDNREDTGQKSARNSSDKGGNNFIHAVSWLARLAVLHPSLW